MNRRWMRIMIGVFVALALVLLGTLIVLFNSLPRLFRPTTTYTAQFTDDVSGLTPGAPCGAPACRSARSATSRWMTRPAPSASSWSSTSRTSSARTSR